MQEKHPIIANGEYYIEPLRKKTFGGPPKLPHEYNEAKGRLGNNIEQIQRQIEQSEEVFMDEKIVCVRLEPKYEAKSYTPNSLIAESKMKFVGGRKYTTNQELSKAKLYFMRATDSELSELKCKLESSQKDNVKKWREQICTINSIDLLKPDEKVLGFDSSWEKGKAEIILHPLGIDTSDVVDKFFELTGISKNAAIVRSYDDGLTFVCANINKDIINKAKKFNPLRSIKPIDDEWDDFFRMSPIHDKGPKLPDIINKSDIKVGVFDGGVQSGTYLVDPFCVNYDMVEEPPTTKGLEHGSAVSGAVLYGSLNGKTEFDVVEPPSVSVESFRVFPAVRTGNEDNDYQMYGTIDIIEKVVKERKDIKIYNISIGPRGAILDDELNRFTYVCDKLSYEVDEGEMNTMTYNFSKNGRNTKKLNLLQPGKIQEAEELMNQGYSKSELPASKPTKKYYREEDLRNSDFKWDTIIKKDISLRSTSLLNPFISLHAIGRDEYEHEKIRYNVVVTIEAPSYRGSLYDNILTTYNNLTPLTIRNIERIRTNI